MMSAPNASQFLIALLHERLGLGGILAFVLILFGSWLATRATAMHRERVGEAIV
jgi:hypothetical protein